MAGGPHDNDPLALDPETMRELGYRTVDLLVERLQREEPPIRRATPAEMRERLHGPAPDHAQPFDEILAKRPRSSFRPRAPRSAPCDTARDHVDPVRVEPSGMENH